MKLETMRIFLRDVHFSADIHYHIDVLFKLLKERTKVQSISHKTMPPYAKHVDFVVSRPYKHWYIITLRHDIDYAVGSIYITHKNEIGIAIFKKYQGQGLGSEALKMISEMYPNAQLLANINPNNKRSIAFFRKHGFEHIQNTYSRS